MKRPPTRTIALTGALALAALAVVGCSSPQTPAGTGTTPVASTSADAGANTADVHFTQMMIVHHQGAIDMAELAPGRAASQEVEDLAARIEAAQQPEIDTMTGWLDSWGEEPLDDDDTMPGMNHSPMAMGGAGGMASPDDLADLEDATGTDFDRLFLELMIAHHEGAVTMATMETRAGQNPDALALAEKMVTDQTAEIAEMKALLAPYAGS